MSAEWAKLQTEGRNPNSRDIDMCSTLEIVQCINNEDKTIPYAIEKKLPLIAEVIDVIYERMKQGGRLIYVGAGTSGRLGVLDASECPPTYGVSPELVQGFIAGGDSALRKAKEGAEDSPELGRQQVAECEVTPLDVVVGISASGTAPYVVGALQETNERGAVSVAITNNVDTPMSKVGQYVIELETGPEVVTGSTRMKAGTSQKLVLNMLSTAVMIKMGKVYHNTMIDLKASNAKLRDRAARIFCWATGAEKETAQEYLALADMDTKLAVCMYLTGLNKEDAQARLECKNGILKQVLLEENIREV